MSVEAQFEEYRHMKTQLLLKNGPLAENRPTDPKHIQIARKCNGTSAACHGMCGGGISHFNNEVSGSLLAMENVMC